MSLVAEKSLVNQVHTIDQAVQLANEIERMEAALKSMKQQLKCFVDENGPIYTRDRVWDYTSSVQWKFGADDLKNMAQDLVLDGVNPWELLTLSAASLKKLGWTEETLSRYGTKKETKRFSSRKK